jgi:hypothetical protein
MMNTSRIAASNAAWRLGTIAALLLAPTIAEACPVCMGGAEEEVRKAFIFATAFLTACPLLMVGGVVWWLRRTLRAASEAEARDALPADDARPGDAALAAAATR